MAGPLRDGEESLEAGILVKDTAINQAHQCRWLSRFRTRRGALQGHTRKSSTENGWHSRMQKDECIQFLSLFKDRPILLFVQVAAPIIGIRLPSLGSRNLSLLSQVHWQPLLGS